jgi:hypothetical protein
LCGARRARADAIHPAPKDPGRVPRLSPAGSKIRREARAATSISRQAR